MEYAIRIMPRAERDLWEIYLEIHAGQAEAAKRWFLGLEFSILSLEHNPRRCPVTPESKRLRHLLYGKKPHVVRVIYRITERPKVVEILHIRHGAMNTFEPTGL
jgi:plasmid stabilization system protein ParE